MAVARSFVYTARHWQQDKQLHGQHNQQHAPHLAQRTQVVHDLRPAVRNAGVAWQGLARSPLLALGTQLVRTQPRTPLALCR